MSDNAIPDEATVRLAIGYVRQNFESVEPWSMTIARAIMDARAKALEEAAKVADEYPSFKINSKQDAEESGFLSRAAGRADIAIAIRALQSEATT